MAPHSELRFEKEWRLDTACFCDRNARRKPFQRLSSGGCLRSVVLRQGRHVPVQECTRSTHSESPSLPGHSGGFREADDGGAGTQAIRRQVDSGTLLRRVLFRRLPSHLDAHHAHSPGVRFYCYTKKISRFKRLVVKDAPDNFLWCYKPRREGGSPYRPEYRKACGRLPRRGSADRRRIHRQTESDLLSVLSKSPLAGIPANRIPHLLKKQGRETFGSLQRARDEKLRANNERADQGFALAH